VSPLEQPSAACLPELIAKLLELQASEQKLKRINAALIERVEGDMRVGDAFAAFAHSVTLAEQVRERTLELTRVNDELRGEIDERTRMEARLREAKYEAEQANLSKTKFLAAVSHDLLQPLNAAQLFAAALAERVPSGAQGAQGLIKNLSHALEDVESLLGTLIAMSKLDAGVIKPDISSFAANDLLQNLASEYREQAARSGLHLDFVSSSVWLHSDPMLLARILRNLLSNAIRYTLQGRVLLGCRRKGRFLSIEVWDSGIGIAPERQQEVFQEFKRGDIPPNQADRGLGLGLSIVDKIARMLGHRIRLHSVAGKGSCFAVEVPRARRGKPQRLTQAGESPLERLSGARVWVLDNDASICAAMRTLLEGWGCSVVTALSTEDLARQVDHFHAEADVLLVDYHLEEGSLASNGLEAIRLINARRAQPLPALMITANYSNELKQQVRKLGLDLLHKPLRPMKLKTVMGHLLAQRGEDTQKED